jgi:hypothetical protein
MRAVLGLTGIAAASAMITAIVRPPAIDTGAAGTPITIVDSTATPIRHVTVYVQLKPGQTAPPSAIVQVVPQPTPRIVVVTTHQSGVP